MFDLFEKTCLVFLKSSKTSSMNEYTIISKKKLFQSPLWGRGYCLSSAPSFLINEINLKKALSTGLVGLALLGADKSNSFASSVDSYSSGNKKEVKHFSIIDIHKIVQIESSGDPNAVNKTSGARGLCQLMKATWLDIVVKMDKDWEWNDAFNPEKNKSVADYYINKEIPRLLKHYKVEDTIETRLAAYNWGIGNLVKLIKRDPKHYYHWMDMLPKETKNYIIKYKSIKEKKINEQLEWLEVESVGELKVGDVIKFVEGVFSKEDFKRGTHNSSYKVHPVGYRTLEGKILNITESSVTIDVQNCYSSQNYMIVKGKHITRRKKSITRNLIRKVRFGEIKPEEHQTEFGFMNEMLKVLS